MNTFDGPPEVSSAIGRCKLINCENASRVELEMEVCLIVSISAAPEVPQNSPTKRPAALPGRRAMYTGNSQHVKVLANITKNAAQFFAAAPPLDSNSESQLWFET